MRGVISKSGVISLAGRRKAEGMETVSYTHLLRQDATQKWHVGAISSDSVDVIFFSMI